MISQSGMLTVLGLGVVFSFLIILIGTMKLVEILIKLTGLDKDRNTTSNVAPTAASAGQNKAIIAAIAAAVNEKQKN
ncbi:MAG TPA: OadG family protein [Treponemataceae bacterium]|nr:OadG family protein [Treponemataceae bacterium]